MDGQLVTIKTISELAGVSVATVSRVINQNGRFSKQTEERVLSIIKDCGYQPNELARGLRTNKAKVIGVIVPDITNDFFSRITLEIQKNLLKEDYVSIICNTDESKEIEQIHYNSLKNLRVCGMIVAGQGVGSINKPDVPTVYIDRSVQKPDQEMEDAPIICSDSRYGACLATKKLIEEGCKNICIVCFSKQAVEKNLRFLGYADAMREAGFSVKDENIYVVDRGDKEIGYQVTRKMLSERSDVDGIFYSMDFLALGGIVAATELKISIPEKLKIVGFDDVMISDMVNPPLTTIHQDVPEIAGKAVETLMAMMKNEKIGWKQYIVPVKLVQRKTT